MQDFATARQNMVDSQVRTNDVTDRRLVEALRDVPRERFVPAERRTVSYAEESLEVAPGRHLLDPRAFSKMAALAAVKDTDSVLDLGTASGYSAAVLGRMAASVVALEENADLAHEATKTLAELGAGNVTVVTGPLVAGWPASAPYDLIFVNGRVDNVPAALPAQLKEHGRLVAIVSDNGVGRATLYVRSGKTLSRRIAFDADAPLLSGFGRSLGFVF